MQQRATRIRVGLRLTIDRSFQPGSDSVVHRLLRTSPARRRHGAGTQLVDDLLPDLGRVADPGRVQPVERQTGRTPTIVVTREAVSAHQSLEVGNREDCGGGCTRRSTLCRSAAADQPHEPGRDGRAREHSQRG